MTQSRFIATRLDLPNIPRPALDHLRRRLFRKEPLHAARSLFRVLSA